MMAVVTINGGGDNRYLEVMIHCIFAPRGIRSKVAKLFLVSYACFFAYLRESLQKNCCQATNNNA